MMAELKKAHEEAPWWVRLSVLLVGGVLVGLLLVVMWNTNEVKTFEEQNRTNAITACERGNEARVATVGNLKNDIHRLDAQLASTVRDALNIQKFLPNSSAWVDSKLREARALREGIEFKQKTINDTLASMDEYAVRKGSPIIDCDKAYPKS